MVSRIVRATLISLPALALTCALGLSAHAQDDSTPAPKPAKKAKKAKSKSAAATPAMTPAAEKAEAPSLVKASGGEGDGAPQGENLKFNTDSAPVNTDRHAPMIFKDPGETPVGTPRKEYAESVPEDSGYKAYIGYPKHQIGIYAAPTSVASKWTGADGAGYNFTTGATALGLNYRLLMTPLWSVEVDYQHYSLKLDPTTLKVGSITYTFLDSKASFDNYYIRNKVCIVGKSTFYQQLCPGFDIGNDGYPIINYETNTSLAMSRVQDLIVGVNLTYQAPVGQSLMFRVIGGYNYGTGIGNSGYLTSKNNSSYFGDASIEWSVNDHNIIVVGGEFKARKAKVSGLRGSTQDSWQTDSSTLGAKLGYTVSF